MQPFVVYLVEVGTGRHNLRSLFPRTEGRQRLYTFKRQRPSENWIEMKADDGEEAAAAGDS